MSRAPVAVPCGCTCSPMGPSAQGMWLMMVAIMAATSSAFSTDRKPIPCEKAQVKCAYRYGCGMALENYLMGCSAVLQGDMALDVCPEICQHSLIALTSTEEGKDLMECECSDELCEQSKQRVEVCRPSVTKANRNESVVSCTVAQWICAADAQCTTAMDYYNRLCRSMFAGKKCTHRCRNSINILRRQEKAAKLKTCKCDGNEDYDCARIQANMQRLCYAKKAPKTEVRGDTTTNVIVRHQHQQHQQDTKVLETVPNSATFAPDGAVTLARSAVLMVYGIVLTLAVAVT